MGSSLSSQICFILDGGKVSRIMIEMIQEILISKACS